MNLVYSWFLKLAAHFKVYEVFFFFFNAKTKLGLRNINFAIICLSEPQSFTKRG